MGYETHFAEDYSFFPSSEDKSQRINTPSKEEWNLALSKCRSNDWQPLTHSNEQETYVVNGHIVDVFCRFEQSSDASECSNVSYPLVQLQVDREDFDSFSPAGTAGSEEYEVSYREEVLSRLQDVAQCIPFPWADSLRPYVINLEMFECNLDDALAHSLVRLLTELGYMVIFNNDLPEPNKPDPAEGIPDTPPEDVLAICLRKLMSNDFLPLDTAEGEVYVVNGNVVKVTIDLAAKPSILPSLGKDVLVYVVSVDGQVYDRVEIGFATDMQETEVAFNLRYQKAVVEYLRRIANTLPLLHN
jgi:hypothetical protein